MVQTTKEYKLLVLILWGNYSEVRLSKAGTKVYLRITELGKLGSKIGLDAYYVSMYLSRLEKLGILEGLEWIKGRREVSGYINLPEVLKEHEISSSSGIVVREKLSGVTPGKLSGLHSSDVKHSGIE